MKRLKQAETPRTTRTATALVRDALEGTGIELVASAPIDVYEARAPEPFRAATLFPPARGVVVVGSAGQTLWEQVRAAAALNSRFWEQEHPLDAHVAAQLDRVDRALASASIRFRRFEPTVHAAFPMDFRALGEVVGLGSMGPFGLLIHPEAGPWWALRGAWFVDAEVDPPLAHPPPCQGCPAPCVAGRRTGAPMEVADASPEVRSRCVIGGSKRYTDEQIAYHYDRARTLARLRQGAAQDSPGTSRTPG